MKLEDSLWFKAPANWDETPEYGELCDAIGPAGLGLPCKLWGFSARSAQTGDLSRYSPKRLAEMLRVEAPLREYGKTPEDLVSALQATGYLTNDLQVVGWKDYLFKLTLSYKTRTANAGKARGEQIKGRAASLSDSPSDETEDEKRHEIRREGDAEHHAQHDADGGKVGVWSAGIWEAYPKRVGRPAALAAIAAAIRREGGTFTAATQLLQATRLYARAVSEWPPDKRQFASSPEKWFAEQRYHDDPAAWRKMEEQRGPRLRPMR